MGKSQEAPLLAVGRNGKRGFGGGSPHYGFFLGISPGHIARTSSRNKMKTFRFEAPWLSPGRYTEYCSKGKLRMVWIWDKTMCHILPFQRWSVGTRRRIWNPVVENWRTCRADFEIHDL